MTMIDTVLASVLEIAVLAQEGAMQPAGAPGGAAPTLPPAGGPGTGGGGGGLDGMFLFLLPAMLVMMVFMTVMGNRKEKKRRAEMMSSIHKGAKVQTVGGLVGEVIEVADETVVIRSEDSRARYSKSAIQQIIESKLKPQQVTEAKPGQTVGA